MLHIIGCYKVGSAVSRRHYANRPPLGAPLQEEFAWWRILCGGAACIHRDADICYSRDQRHGPTPGWSMSAAALLGAELFGML